MVARQVVDVEAPTRATPRAVTGWRQRRSGQVGVALAFLAPALLILLAVRVVPLAEAVWLSLTNWDGFAPPAFIGVENFTLLVSDPVFWQSLRNTGVVVLAIPLWVLGPLVIALGLRSRTPGWRVFRIAYFIPAILSPVIVGTYYSVLLRFDGPVNDLLGVVGLDAAARGWLTDAQTALPVTVAVILWAGFGVGVLLYLAALGNVDQSLYDAARVDGASTSRVHWHVTLPQVLPVVEFYTVVVLISCFTTLFPYIYTLTRGGPGYATNLLDFYVYTSAFEAGQFGYASAIGVVLLAVLMVAVAVVWALFRRKSR